ncbi:MAG TPA: L,D-transpeptidase family protein [Mycobacteriales bacterium]|nr:L,D-transpeptidase family protein [Mycobacteriales bacterium]
MSGHRRRHRGVFAVVAFCVLSVAGLGGVVALRLAGHPARAGSGAGRSLTRSALAPDRAANAGNADQIAPPTLPATVPTTAVPAPLRAGASGPAVTRLQQRLAALGYQSRERTGRFDTETTHAVIAFEKVNGLPPDGVAGPAVMAALDHPAVPRQHHPRHGLAVEVDLARQVAVVFTDGAVTRIYDVCTGKPTTPTPPGEFAVKYKIDGMHQAPLGPMWRPVYFNYDGFAFHGAEPVLTTPSSHGCVRMTDPAMNELFAMLTPGVPVTIF